MPSQQVKINIVAYQDGDLWVAQCVEYDISARADSLPKLPRAFSRALAANISVNRELGREGLSGIAPAPDRFRDWFERAQMDVTAREPLPSLAPFHIEELRVAEAA